MFLRVREVARVRVAATFRALVPAADEASVQLLTTYALAAADGLFIAKEIGGDSVDLSRCSSCTRGWSSMPPRRSGGPAMLARLPRWGPRA